MSSRVSAERVHNRWHPGLEPVATVRPGEELTLETRDGIAGQLTRESVHADAGRLDLGLAHPLTGPIHVEGAEPGDLLEVEFLAYETDDFGVTAIIPGFGFLADLFPDPFVVKWELADGLARSERAARRRRPGGDLRRRRGRRALARADGARCAGARRRFAARGGPTAEPMPESAIPPSAAAGLRTIPPRETGGNMDVRHLVAGSRLYLPVQVPGALFSVGDLHFAQGDGEVCGTGIEVGGAATMRFAVHRDRPRLRRFPSYETPARPGRRSFATTGIPVDAPMDLTVAAREALIEMIDWLEAAHGLARPAAYALCSVAVDLRLSEVVDVPYPLVSALLPLDVFATDLRARCGRAVVAEGQVRADRDHPATRLTNAPNSAATSAVSTSPPSTTSPSFTSMCRLSAGIAKVPSATSSRISRAISSSERTTPARGRRG